MSKGRKILLIAFIVTSIFGMWARYAYQKSEERKRERLLASLADSFRQREREAEEKRAAEARANLTRVLS